MISIPQTQIALYLHDYTALISRMLTSPKKQPFELFKEHLLESNRIEDANETNYNRMLNIAYIFTKMKIFSIAEDYNLKSKNNFINNADLDLSFLDSCITGNRTAISNKKLLQMIRDGFNHTTETNQLYRISPNCKFIEFSFKQPSPITIKLSINDISSLTDSIAEASQNLQCLSFEQPPASTPKEFYQNMEITRHFFPKKVDKSTIKSFIELEGQGKYSESIDLAKSIDKQFEKKLKLTDLQINTIIKRMEELLNSGAITLEQFQANHQELAIILIGKELPLPILKYDYYMLDSYIIGQLLPHKVFSYEDMMKIFIKAIESNEETPMTRYKDFLDQNKNLIFKTYYTNETEKLAYTSLLFIEYVLSNFPPEDEYIRIGNRTVEYRKLRNSLVHGRWHLERDKVVFYDALPDVGKELDFNWTVKIKLTDLHHYCTNILQKKISKEQPKQLTKSIFETIKDTHN